MVWYGAVRYGRVWGVRWARGTALRPDPPWTVILPRVLALPAELVAKHMYWPESSAVMLSRMRVQEPSGSSMMMWCGSACTGRPSVVGEGQGQAEGQVSDYGHSTLNI